MIWLIILLAFFLRIISLDQSLWWDEAINVVYAKSADFWNFITKYPIGDFHPPGYFVILWGWGHLFGFSEISVRLPSVIFGLLTVYFTYLIGKTVFTKKVGLLAALFLTVAPLHIYYSQEARMYSMAAFTITLSSFLLIKLLNKKIINILVYAFSVGLVFYSDYAAYFILPAYFLWIFFYQKKIIKTFILSAVGGVVLWIPWVPILYQQLSSGLNTANLIIGWKETVGGTSLKDGLLLPVKILVGRINFSSQIIYVLTSLLVGSVNFLIFVKALKKIDERLSLLLFWLVIPPLVAFLFSFYIPIFSYFRFIFILPAFYLLIALGVDKFNKPLKSIFIMLIITAEVIFSAMYLFNTKFHREDWKKAVGFINQGSDNKTTVLHKNNEIPASFVYYKVDSVNSQAAFNKIPVSSTKDFIDLDKELTPFNKIFLFNYLVDITDPNRLLEKELKRLGFKKIKDYDFRGVGFVELYAKQF